MRPTLSYQAYQASGYSSLSQASFEAALPLATSLVDSLTAPRKVVPSNQGAYLKAICAVIDVHAKYGLDGLPLTGISIGSFSASSSTGRDGVAVTGRSLGLEAARLALTTAVPSLLYGGIR